MEENSDLTEALENDFDKHHVEKLALKAYERRKYEEAANYFTELTTKSEHKDVEWYIKRCDCYQHLNMDAEAIHDANMVVNLHPESYKGYSLLGTLNQIQGHYDEALFCYFDCLEILWLEGSAPDQIVDNCIKDIIRSARPVSELPSNIGEQSILTQLYILGNSLRREVQHTLAIRSMEVALLVYERTKMKLPAGRADSSTKPTPVKDDNIEEKEKSKMDEDEMNESLKMKIHFVLAQSQQGIGKFAESIENFKMSSSVALRIGDVSYETKTYLHLSTLCLDHDRHAEAASYYIKLLAVGRDVLSAVGDDQTKFREHWSMEMEASILLNLCIAFKSLRLYDEALIYAERYDSLIGLINASPTPTPDVIGFAGQFTDDFRPKSVPTLGFMDSIFTQRSVDLSGILQSKFILGDLQELRGDFESAMKYYTEWMNLSQTLAKDKTSFENPFLLDTASALSCQGSVHMKQLKHKEALECFKQQSKIAKMTKVPQLIMESALSRGDSLILLGRIEEARNVFNYAQKLSRSMEDLEPECMCMWKVASVFAAEHRFTHAAYYCEQAAALANKCGKRSVQMKLNFELALYYQYSNSPKELQKAANILYEMIQFQEEHIYSHRSNGGKYFHEEENMLGKCYNAMQVILHKLDQAEMSFAFVEAYRRRKFIQLFDKRPQIPVISMSAITDADPKKEMAEQQEQEDTDKEESDLDLINYHNFIPTYLQNDAVVLSYSLHDEGFLVQLINPGKQEMKSYLSSTYDIKPFSTRPRIEDLVEKLGKITENKQLRDIYNSETRCLPQSATHFIPVPKMKNIDKINKTNEGLESGDHGVVKGKTIKPEDGSGEAVGEVHNRKKLSVLEELHEILIQPLDEMFMNFQQNQHIIVIADKALKKIPFDCLINPSSKRLLGERFNITIAQCTYLLHNQPDDSHDRNLSPKTNSSFSHKEPSIKQKSSPRPKSSARSQRKSPRPTSFRSPRKSEHNKAVKDFRHNELLKSFGDEDSLQALDLCGFSSSISRLVTKTATGTNVLTSPRYIPPYKQDSKKQKCTVIGCPSLPLSLHYQGEIWNPRSKLPVAMKECKKVSEYFDVSPILGDEATKRRFIEEIKTSSILHISTFVDINKGFIAWSPDSFPISGSIPDEDTYLFKPEDLKLLQLDNLHLAVLLCGHGWPNITSSGDKESNTTLNLPAMLLSAGASSVLHQLWNVPDFVMELFLFHFYDSLQDGNLVSKAVANAKEAVRKKHSDPIYWSGIQLYGSDVFVNLSDIRTSQLHASLDLVEAESLNPKCTVNEVITPEIALRNLQMKFSQLSGNLIPKRPISPYIEAKDGQFRLGEKNVTKHEAHDHEQLGPTNRDVVGALIELLEEAMDRLTADSNTDRPVIILPEIISNAEGAVDLLLELGFDFQPADVPRPPPDLTSASPFIPGQEVTAVVFPHWNKDGMLLPAHQALTGLQDICSSDTALQCLARILPLSQATLCSLIDLLAVTRHTPEVQLRVHDDGVSVLWRNRYIRKYLEEIGFMQVHGLAVFFKISKHRTLLIASLQLFASLCLHRDQSVLEQLNITTLGESPKMKNEAKKVDLSTVKPVILPRKEVVLTSSWMQKQPDQQEEKEIKQFAEKLFQVKSEYKRSLEHAKWWHKNLLTPQAQIKMSEYGVEKAPRPMKRKVKPGATPSCQRESVGDSPEPHSRDPFYKVFNESMQKRDYANYLSRKRYNELDLRYKAKVHEIYSHYAVN
ncbi:uncharacterized protein LOC120339972 isoform X1 [Styela clava]